MPEKSSHFVPVYSFFFLIWVLYVVVLLLLHPDKLISRTKLEKKTFFFTFFSYINKLHKIHTMYMSTKSLQLINNLDVGHVSYSNQLSSTVLEFVNKFKYTFQLSHD